MPRTRSKKTKRIITNAPDAIIIRIPKHPFFSFRNVSVLLLLCMMFSFASFSLSKLSLQSRVLEQRVLIPNATTMRLIGSALPVLTTLEKPAQKQELPEQSIISHGSKKKKVIALTFDADMTPTMEDFLKTGEVVTFDDTHITDYLAQTKTKATFFLTGMWIEEYPDATRELGANPLFELANHSYSHPSFAGDCYGLPQVPESQLPEQIEKTQRLLQTVGHRTSKYFRFPGGCYDQKALGLVKQEGLQVVHWSDVADDGFNTNTEGIIQAVIRQAHNGAIIVMHLGGETNTPVTADALAQIVPTLKAEGYTFVTVSELLHPAQPKTLSLRSYLLSSVME